MIEKMAKKNHVDLFKKIMGSYPTGVTVVTTHESSGPVGLTVNSFASVSIDPLMVLWCIDKGSDRYDAFKDADKFAVNVLAGDQKEECALFAKSKEQNRFSKVNWELSSNQLPIIEGVFGVIECKCTNKVDAGDHLILIGEVIDLSTSDRDPMLYYRRNVGVVPSGWEQ